MKRNFLASVVAAAALLTIAAPANAVSSVGANKAALQDAASSSVQPIHYRKYRHSHRGDWRRGRRGGKYGYNRRPRIYLDLGGSRRGYSNYRRHDRRYR